MIELTEKQKHNINGDCAILKAEVSTEISEETGLGEICSAILSVLLAEEISDGKQWTKLFLEQKITYICWSKEVGENGTPHLQGYLQLETRKRRGWLSKRMTKCYLTPSKGTPEENRAYCSKMKNPTFIEIGTISVQGARNDLEEIRDQIKAGATERDIANGWFKQWARYRGSFTRYRLLVNPVITNPNYPLTSFPESWTLTLRPPAWEWKKSLMIIGPPDIGKTEFAKALLGPCLMVSHMDDLLKYDPEVHGGILFDDMSFDHYPRGAQIHLTDVDNDRSIHCRYNVAFIPANTKKIFVCNHDDIFTDDPAINRRLMRFKVNKF